MKPIWQDIVLITAFIANAGALIFTMLILNAIKVNVGWNTALYLEANIVGRFLLSNPFIHLAILLVIYSLVGIKYYYGRKFVLKHRTAAGIFALNSFVLLIFFLLMLDFLNDLGYILILL